MLSTDVGTMFHNLEFLLAAYRRNFYSIIKTFILNYISLFSYRKSTINKRCWLRIHKIIYASEYGFSTWLFSSSRSTFSHTFSFVPLRARIYVIKTHRRWALKPDLERYRGSLPLSSTWNLAHLIPVFSTCSYTHFYPTS